MIIETQTVTLNLLFTDGPPPPPVVMGCYPTQGSNILFVDFALLMVNETSASTPRHSRYNNAHTYGSYHDNDPLGWI